MLIYYRWAGVNADVALIFNLIILLGFMGYFGAVLTLPGIAGVILTVGMGVDSNVLIFERIREELRNGKTPPSAVEQGFSHAWITIVDTHVTTIVSAAILFIFGTGPVKGFATTLVFGLTGQLVYSSLRIARDFRLGVGTETAWRGIKHLAASCKLRACELGANRFVRGSELEISKLKLLEFDLEFFRNTNIDFLGKKWYFLAFSLVFSVAGLGSMLFWHGIPLGVDFRGGTLVYVKYSHTPDPAADAYGHRPRRPEKRPRAEVWAGCQQ